MKIGLVLEGGGMRGLYSTGVLDCFLDHDIMTDYVIGVSAGACHGVSYLSKQRGRSFRINTAYLKDKRYLSIRNFLKTKSLFGMDFLFDEIPHKLDIFDYETFLNSPCEYKLAVTDVKTGKPIYFDKTHLNHDSTILKASCSIPMFANIVEIDGYNLVDGGVSDSIPIEYAIKQGCDKNIVILTRDKTYRKSKVKFSSFVKRKYKKYPKLIESIENRHLNYNKSLDLVKYLEEKGDAFVIRPKSPVKVSQIEKDVDKLTKLYNDGYNDAKESYEKIMEFINK